MTKVKTRDGVEIFSKDWGEGRALVFLHSWAVTNDIWHYQHAHFVERGYRVIAFDRRGHGRSTSLPTIASTRSQTTLRPLWMHTESRTPR